MRSYAGNISPAKQNAEEFSFSCATINTETDGIDKTVPGRHKEEITGENNNI